MNYPEFPKHKRYELPKDDRQVSPKAIAGYALGFAFCCAFWILFGYAAGCHVGWLGQ